METITPTAEQAIADAAAALLATGAAGARTTSSAP